MAQTTEGGQAINLTASGAVSLIPGTLLGFYVNSTSSGTVVVKNGTTTAGTAVSGTITPAVGYHRFPATLSTGCFIDVGATLNATFFFSPG